MCRPQRRNTEMAGRVKYNKARPRRLVLKRKYLIKIIYNLFMINNLKEFKRDNNGLIINQNKIDKGKII